MTQLYVLFSVLALMAGLLVVLQRNPVYSALSLLVAFVAMGFAMILLGSPFLGAVFLIIYAGAIITLFLFALMLLNLRRPSFDFDFSPRSYAGVIAVGAVWAATLFALFHTPELQRPFSVNASFDPAFYRMGLFQQYIVPFEILSVLLLVALVAVLALTRKEGTE